jgi:hypothetical protein
MRRPWQSLRLAARRMCAGVRFSCAAHPPVSFASLQRHSVSSYEHVELPGNYSSSRVWQANKDATQQASETPVCKLAQWPLTALTVMMHSRTFVGGAQRARSARVGGEEGGVRSEGCSSARCPLGG